MKTIRINAIRGVINPMELQVLPKEFNYKLLTLFKKTSYDKGRKIKVKYFEDRDLSKLVLVKTFQDELDEKKKLKEIKILLQWAFNEGTLSEDDKMMFIPFSPEEADQRLIKRRKRVISKLRRDAEGTPMEALTTQVFKDFKEEISLFEETGSSDFKSALLTASYSYLGIKINNVEVRNIITSRL